MTTLRLSEQIDEAEIKMRRALRVEEPTIGGRNEASPEPRATRRFAQSGDVPVTRFAARKDSPSTSALVAAEQALQAERQGREHAEAALAQASAAIVTLQTKLAHAEIAHAEAMAVERRRHEFEQRRAAALAVEDLGVVVPERAARVIISEDHEPEGREEPVQWWVPGWQGNFRR